MTERDPAVGDGDRGALSRRGFLLATGAAAAASVPTATAATERGMQTIAVSPPEQAAAEDAVANAGSAVRIERSPTTRGIERFAAGEVGAVVGSRPMLPAERARVEASGVDYARREVVSDAAALRPPESTWVECLSPGAVAATWSADGAVETWAEVDGRAVPGISTAAPAPRDEAADRGRPATRDVLVRGSRAYQYASGAGGVGYYEPGDDWLVRQSTGADTAVPVVRLAYLYADRDALDGSPTARFVRTYARQIETQTRDVSYADRPFESA